MTIFIALLALVNALSFAHVSSPCSAAQPSVQRSGELSPQCSEAFNSSVSDLTPLAASAPCSDTPIALCNM